MIKRLISALRSKPSAQAASGEVIHTTHDGHGVVLVPLHPDDKALLAAAEGATFASTTLPSGFVTPAETHVCHNGLLYAAIHPKIVGLERASRREIEAKRAPAPRAATQVADRNPTSPFTDPLNPLNPMSPVSPMNPMYHLDDAPRRDRHDDDAPTTPAPVETVKPSAPAHTPAPAPSPAPVSKPSAPAHDSSPSQDSGSGSSSYDGGSSSSYDGGSSSSSYDGGSSSSSFDGGGGF